MVFQMISFIIWNIIIGIPNKATLPSFASGDSTRSFLNTTGATHILEDNSNSSFNFSENGNFFNETRLTFNLTTDTEKANYLYFAMQTKLTLRPKLYIPLKLLKSLCLPTIYTQCLIAILFRFIRLKFARF